MSQIIRATFSYTLYGQVCQNVIHFQNNSDTYDPAEIAFILEVDWIGVVKGFQLPEVHYFDLAIRNMDDVTGVTSHATLDIFGGGFFGAQSIPVVTVMIQVRTAFGGRKGRGRVFISGIHTGSFVAGQFNPDTVTALNGFMDQLKAKFITGSPRQLTIGVCGHGTNPSFHPAVDLVVGPRCGVQRRRNIGVGI